MTLWHQMPPSGLSLKSWLESNRYEDRTMKVPMLARATNFAHLLGMKPRSARAKEEEEQRRAEEKENEQEAAAAEEEEEEEEAEEEEDERRGKKGKKAKKAKKAKRVEEEEEDPDAEEEEEEEEAEEEEDDKKAKGYRSGYRDALARCAAVFAAPAAAARPDIAAQLAFDPNNRMSAKQMVDVVTAAANGMPRGGRSSLHERMQGVHVASAGPGGGAPPAKGSPEATAAEIAAAVAKARGK